MSLNVMVLSLVFSHLAHAPYFACATGMAWRLLSSKWWISFETILRSFFVISYDHHRCGWRPTPALSVATDPITSFILREDSLVSIAYLSFHFWIIIMAGCAKHTACKILMKECNFTSIEIFKLVRKMKDNSSSRVFHLASLALGQFIQIAFFCTLGMLGWQPKVTVVQW